MSGVRRAASQSIVEFALIAPALIILAMAAWDGGSVLRELLVLQEAARDGARAGATAYGGVPPGTGGSVPPIIAHAVTASASDLPALTSQMITITSSDAQSITVTVRYPHTLITPVLRQLWGGGTLMLSANSTFFVPQMTPTTGTIVPSTPTPTPIPTATPVPRTATAVPST